MKTIPVLPRVFIALSLLICFAGMDRPQFARAAPPVPAPQAAQTADGDGDDPREELLYHWQDVRFARDEQRQIVAIVLGLGLLKLASVGRKSWIRKRGTA